MTLRKISKMAAGALAASALVLAGSPAQGVVADPAAPSFAEFRASTFKDADGQYIVNGDEALADDQALREYYDRMVALPKKQRPGTTDLVVNTVGGYDDLWSSSQATNLTYCVSDSFGSAKSDIVSATAAGAALWESASSGIDFTYVSSQDSNCNTSNSSVVFSVEPTTTTQYIARAFFPSTPKSQRNVLVNADSLMNSGSWTPGNIMGHELGHTLGFRHEHTRPEAGTCFEDNNWRPLTPYDSISIMHYPQCNGGSSTLSFSANDGTGVRSVYGG